MNSSPINSGAINASVSFASIVYLPSATATIALTVSERISVTLSGTSTIGMSPDGDISKVSNLGDAQSTITVESAGSLTLNKRLYFGDSGFSMGMTPVGNLQRVLQLPTASTAMNFAVTGTAVKLSVMGGLVEKNANLTSNLVRKVVFGSQSIDTSLEPSGPLAAYRFLGGNAGIDLNPSASLAKGVRVYMTSATTATALEPSGNLRMTARMAGASPLVVTPSGTLSRGVRVPVGSEPVQMAWGVSGNLRQTIRFAGNTDTALSLSGQLTRLVSISGVSTIRMGLSGDLANNAQSADLEKLLMVRKPVNREMER